MDYLNSNVIYYIKCRDHLLVKYALIFNECKRLFGNESPKSSKSIAQLVALKQFHQNKSIFNESQDSFRLDYSIKMNSLQFDIKKMCEYQMLEEISFYICCRFQLNSDLSSIINDLQILYPTIEHTLTNVEQLISFCFNLNQKCLQLPCDDSFVKVIKEEIETQIDTSYPVAGLNASQYAIDSAMNLQEKLELADLECSKLRSKNKKLEEQNEELLVQFENFKAEYETYKSETSREIACLRHDNSHLQDSNKNEQEANLRLRTNLSSYSSKLKELVKDLSNKTEVAEKWKEKHDSLTEENLSLKKNLKQKSVSDSMHRDNLMKATSIIEQLKKNEENFIKEIKQLKTCSTRVEYFRFLKERSEQAKNLKEFDLTSEKVKKLENELDAKTEAWIDQANKIKQLEVQILNLKAVNIDLETRLNTNYYNIYASNFFHSTNYNKNVKCHKISKFKETNLSCSGSNEKVNKILKFLSN